MTKKEKPRCKNCGDETTFPKTVDAERESKGWCTACYGFWKKTPKQTSGRITKPRLPSATSCARKLTNSASEPTPAGRRSAATAPSDVEIETAITELIGAHRIDAGMGNDPFPPGFVKAKREKLVALMRRAQRSAPAPSALVEAAVPDDRGLLQWCMSEVARCSGGSGPQWRGGIIAMRAVVQEIHRRFGMGPSPWVDPQDGLPPAAAGAAPQAAQDAVPHDCELQAVLDKSRLGPHWKDSWATPLLEALARKAGAK